MEAETANKDIRQLILLYSDLEASLRKNTLESTRVQCIVFLREQFNKTLRHDGIYILIIMICNFKEISTIFTTQDPGYRIQFSIILLYKRMEVESTGFMIM